MDLIFADLRDALITPFVEFTFMRRALVATFALSLSAAPLGVFLTLRRMSLLGDALSHAVLPGVAIGFMVSGLSLTAMAAGGVLAGMLVVAIAGAVSRFTLLKEDASLAAIYLLALALGVILISRHGTQLDLLHILFGSALGVDEAGLMLVASVSTVTVLLLAAMYRGLVLEVFDPLFLNASRKSTALARSKLFGPWIWHQGFLILVVVNLVAGFQTPVRSSPPSLAAPTPLRAWGVWGAQGVGLAWTWRAWVAVVVVGLPPRPPSVPPWGAPWRSCARVPQRRSR